MDLVNRWGSSAIILKKKNPVEILELKNRISVLGHSKGKYRVIEWLKINHRGKKFERKWTGIAVDFRTKINGLK